jgi:hypothetical protein
MHIAVAAQENTWYIFKCGKLGCDLQKQDRKISSNANIKIEQPLSKS